MSGVRIALDIFPAAVRLPHGARISPCRIAIADGALTVWVDGNNGSAPQVYFTRPEVISTEGNPVSGYSLQVADGIVEAYREGGCGCGSQLRSWDPWPDMTHYSVPL